MLVVAAVPWLFLRWLPNDWGAFLGGTAFLTIPQLTAWALFVGLRTGRMPSAYGGSESLAESPIWFWALAAGYAAVVLVFLWIGMVVALPG